MTGLQEREGRAGARVEALDGLRAIAVLAVFVYHAARDSLPILIPAYRYVEHADIGVEVFFVLSGYLVYRPFAAAHLSGHAAPELRSYARRRAFRIFPLYWVALAVLAAAGRVTFEGIRGLLTRVLLVHSYFGDHGGRGFDQSWTLVVEVSFYAFIPLWAVATRAAGRRLGEWRSESLGALALIAFGVGAQALLRSPTWWPPLLVLPPALGSLGAGMLVAIIDVGGGAVWRERISRALRSEAAVLAAVVLLYLALTRLDPTQFFLRFDINLSRLAQGYLQTLTAVLLVVWLVLGDQERGVSRRALCSRPLVWAGLVSYGVYLWHFDLIHALPDWLLNDHGVAPAVVGLAVALAAALAAAGVSHYLLERPAMRLGRRRRDAMPRLAGAPSGDAGASSTAGGRQER